MVSRSFTLVAGATVLNGVVASLYGESPLNHTCILEKPLLSCPPTNISTVDSCCSEAFGGLLLATQFWDTYTGLEAQGQLLPKKTWTLHGLWPDFCNGSYTQYCDLGRQYDPDPSPNTTTGTPSGTPVIPYTGPDIGTFVEDAGRADLKGWMNKYWIAQNQPNPDFWGHEFSKHATCFSTFDVPCYGPHYRKHEDVIDFFETTIMYYLRLPTYKWLTSSHIVPSNSTTYSVSRIQNALKKKYGHLPYVGCSGARWNETEQGRGSMDNGRTILSEVWYYFHVLGRPQDGRWRGIDATGSGTSCAKADGAVKYLKRTLGSEFEN
ncbi:ribonuclease T2 [Patellaria atrata CBS 101060]|uniref:ribonuclease T2 n=1 Tax=Patellaria atrata CBS 101060 TaxID=1346257 RepID=A0A9P4S2M1_9PEZI|nr:ribonuclease T2 [Patellaria atrata CBS 101060]